MKPEEYVRKLLDLNLQLKGIIDAPSTNIRANDKNLLHLCILTNYAKAYKTHQAVMILCAQGFGEDALILARTILEIGINLRYILQDNKTKSDMILRYFHFDFVQRYRMYTGIIKNPKDHKRLVTEREPTASDISIEVIKQKHDEFLEKYKDAKGNPPQTQTWSGLSISTMANKLGLEKTYATAYELGSKQTHSSTLATGKLLDIEKDGTIRLHTEPSLNDCDTALTVAFEHFYYLLEVMDKELKLNIRKDLDKIETDFKKLLS